MSETILLDSGVLGLISHPRPSPEFDAWFVARLRGGFGFLVPEIADYEVRRELLRLGSRRGVRRLDDAGRILGYLPLPTGVMRHAAELWAEARRSGRPTASAHALDADVILAAQAIALTGAGRAVVVATTNAKHLARFVDARPWSEIG